MDFLVFNWDCQQVKWNLCLSSAAHSADWLMKNFGFFSRFASITDFYRLNSNFSGVNVERPRKSEWIYDLGLFQSENDFLPPVSRAAGGSSPPVSESDGRVAAAASSYSTWEGRRHRPRVRLPVGVSQRQEASRGPVLDGSTRQKGNSFGNSRHLKGLTSVVKCNIFHIFRLICPAAPTDKCECERTRRCVI